MTSVPPRKKTLRSKRFHNLNARRKIPRPPIPRKDSETLRLPESDSMAKRSRQIQKAEPNRITSGSSGSLKYSSPMPKAPAQTS